MPPRDVLVTVGTEILESTMSYRSRWFEYLCYRPLIESYFHADPMMRWEAAPKPRLTDVSFTPGFWDEFESLSHDEQIERVRANDLGLTEAEPLFDAADIGRFGKDLFVQLSLVTNRGGYRWVRQHFPNCVEESEVELADQLDKHGFEVVPVPFWDVAPFGGGLHCATVDIERDGELQDYFPRRYGRF
jgi:glycine amidinotransferase